MRIRAAIIAVSLLIGAVPQPAPAQRSDTTLYRPRAGGAWRTPRVATELLVLRGSEEGQDFGELMDVLALSDGRVVVFDGRGVSGPELLLFDSAGMRLRRLGREGAGPGEYGARLNIGGLAEGPGGEIWLFDPAAQRILRWARDGALLPAVVPTAPIGPVLNAPLYAGPEGTLWVPAQLRPDATDASAHGYLRLAPSGAVRDTLRMPAIPGETTSRLVYQPQWLFHPLQDGGVVSARTDAASLFVRVGSSGRLLRVELPLRGTPFLAVERAELQALLDHQARETNQPPARLPAAKPVVAAIQLDATGGVIWLRRPAEGRRIPPEERLSLGAGIPMLSFAEPMAFSAVSREGNYLGELRFERPRIGRVSFAGETAWGIAHAVGGETLLVKWRVPGR